MAYRTPTFNLLAHIWRHGVSVLLPPTLTVNVNLRGVAKAGVYDLAATNVTVYVELLLPAITDIRGISELPGSDTVEVPAGSGRYYRAIYVDDVAKGFPNEYRYAYLVRVAPFPSPLP